jgi:hypothetical protein
MSWPAHQKCHQLTGKRTSWHLRVSHSKDSEVLGGTAKGAVKFSPREPKEGGDDGYVDHSKCNHKRP